MSIPNQHKHLEEQLAQHRSIRCFSNLPVDNQLVDKLIEQSINGTSTFGNMLSYSLVKTYKLANKEKLYAAHDYQESVRQAPLIITICADLSRTERWLKLKQGKSCLRNLYGLIVGIVDATLLAQTLALSCQSSGLGICFLGSTLSGSKKISTILQLPDLVFPVTSIIVGHPSEKPAKRNRLPLSAVVHEECYKVPSDDELLRQFSEKEQSCWARYQSNPEIKRKMEEYNITNLAQYYSSELKYGPEHNLSISNTLTDLLTKAGWLRENIP